MRNNFRITVNPSSNSLVILNIRTKTRLMTSKGMKIKPFCDVNYRNKTFMHPCNAFLFEFAELFHMSAQQMYEFTQEFSTARNWRDLNNKMRQKGNQFLASWNDHMNKFGIVSDVRVLPGFWYHEEIIPSGK